MNNSYITIIKEKRTALSRKRIPLNQNECTADFRIGVPFEQNLQTMAKKLSRVSILDEETQSYTTAAYLIAQLGKNYSLPKNKRIPGNILLGFALETISSLKYSVGGVMEFLECEDNEFLLSFYTQNHFKPFDTRITASQNNESHTLHQLLKFI